MVGDLRPTGAAAESRSFALVPRLDPGRIASCGLPAATHRFLLDRLVGGPALVGSVRVEVDVPGETVLVELIVGEGDGYVLSMGGVRGSAGPWTQGPGGLRAAVQGGWLGVFPPGGEETAHCPGAVDFEVLLTGAGDP